MKRIIVFSLIAYLLILFQSSFLVHFAWLGSLPSLTIVFILLLNILEKQNEKTGLAIGIIGGFLLDAFSAKPFGFYVLILFVASLVIKFLLKRYIRLEIASTIYRAFRPL